MMRYTFQFISFLFLFVFNTLLAEAQSIKPVSEQDSTSLDSATNIHPHHKRQLLVLPVAARSIETSWSFGLAASLTFKMFKDDTSSRTSNIQGLGLYSVRKQFVTAVTGTQYFKKERYILYEQLSYSSFPDKFWGLGKNAPDKAEESYSFKQYYVTFHLMRNLGHNFYLGSIFELQKLINVSYKSGGLFDQQNVAGRRPYLISGLGLSLTYDSRNSAFSPNKGSFAQVYFNHFDKYLGSDYVYTNIVVNLCTFIRTYKEQVLALQVYSFSNIGDAIPLRSLATLGGSSSMRGYYDGRYRDKQQLVTQAEYRIPVFWRFGAVAFGGIGDVGHSLDNFSLKDLKFTYGAGLRFAINRSEKLNLRLDYGFGMHNNNGLYFQIGEAF